MFVSCKNCHANLLKFQLALGAPCPTCGSTSREYLVAITEKAAALNMIGAKDFKGGKSKRKGLRIETKDGFEKRGDTGGAVEKHQLIDHVNKRAVKRVVDAGTGEVLRYVDHPLTDHIDRGDAKPPISS